MYPEIICPGEYLPPEIIRPENIRPGEYVPPEIIRQQRLFAPEHDFFGKIKTLSFTKLTYITTTEDFY